MPTGLLTLVVVLTCSGCFSGHDPSASRIRPDSNDRYFPQGSIHFVEAGHRSKGVLVSATSGFDSAFSASWTTVLVPTPPSELPGPVWTPRPRNAEVTGDDAVAIDRLPMHRQTSHTLLYGNLLGFRFRQLSVWVLSTNPFILGLPAGEPKRPWRKYAVTATGVTSREVRQPLDPFVCRYVVDEELDQPLDRLVVFPSDFWNAGESIWLPSTTVSVVTLPQPLSIDDALNALTHGDPTKLGAVEQVSMDEHFESEKARNRAYIADRNRLLNH